ncbi:hypothetical protein DICPUDRAFT_15974, partial [Dictyostelium purpureum]
LQADKDGSNIVNYCLNIKNGSKDQNTPVILWPIQKNSTNELWQLTSDGHIISRMFGNVVLDVGNSVDGSNSKFYVIINPNFNVNSDSQKWVVNSETNQISNKNFPNLYLGIDGAYNGPIAPVKYQNIVLAKPSDNSNPCFQWLFLPKSPFYKILSQKPEPFPTYEKDPQFAETYHLISKTITLDRTNSIRTQYSNTIAPLSSFQSSLVSMKCPKDVNPEVFEIVKDQINYELTCAISVQNLFATFSKFYTENYICSEASITNLALLCKLDSKKDLVTGFFKSFIDNTTTNILCMIPEIGPIFTEFVDIGYDLYADSGYSTNNISPFTVAVSQLYKRFYTNFINILKIIGEIETDILNDWGMMKTTYSCIMLPVGTPNSLFWNTNMNYELVNATSIANDIAILQVLMPSKYQIYYCSFGINYTNAPSYCQYWDNRKQFYYIAEIQDNNAFPDSELMKTYLWGNNVNQQEFYQSNFGWTFNTANNDVYKNRIYNQGLPTLFNGTSTPMYYNLVNNGTPVKCNVYTYSSGFFSGEYSTGLLGSHEYQIEIYDFNNNQLMSFTVSVDLPMMKGCTPRIVGSPTIASGYYFVNQLSCEGSRSQEFAGSLSFAIY